MPLPVDRAQIWLNVELQDMSSHLFSSAAHA